MNPNPPPMRFSIGDVCLAGAAELANHADGCYPYDLRFPAKEPWHFKTDESPHIAVSVVIDECAAHGGPMRITTWRHMRRSLMMMMLDDDGGTCGDQHPPAYDGICSYASLHGLAKGSIIVRDIRLWHGGCTNSSNIDRFLPGTLVSSVDGLSYGYENGVAYRPRRTMPSELYQQIQSDPDHPLHGHCDYIARY